MVIWINYGYLLELFPRIIIIIIVMIIITTINIVYYYYFIHDNYNHYNYSTNCFIMMILIDWKLLKIFSKKDPTTMGMAGAADGLLA